jgi:hypothetical protein
VVRYDQFIQKLQGRLYLPDMTFKLLHKAGEWASYKGLYLICDGGYHQCRCMHSLSKHCEHQQDVDTAAWSKHVESVLNLKDIKCCFGILKGRFRILKMPALFEHK